MVRAAIVTTAIDRHDIAGARDDANELAVARGIAAIRTQLRIGNVEATRAQRDPLRYAVQRSGKIEELLFGPTHQVKHQA